MGLIKAFIRGVIAIFVLLAGLVAAVFMGVVAVLYFLLRRPRPARTPAGPAPENGARAIPNSSAEVIDVTATDVPADSEKTA